MQARRSSLYKASAAPPDELPQPVIDYWFNEGSGHPASSPESQLSSYGSYLGSGFTWSSSSIWTGSNKTTSYCQISDNDLLTATDCRFTMSVYFQRYTDTNPDRYITSKSDFKGNKREWYLRHTNGTLEFGIAETLLGNWSSMYSDIVFPLNVASWIFAVGEGNGVFRMYINETLVGEVLDGITSTTNGAAKVNMGALLNHDVRLPGSAGAWFRYRWDNQPLSANQRALLIAEGGV